MTLGEAVGAIVLPLEKGERVLVAERDTHPDWATDRQALYVNKDRTFTWTYESGCSCYTDTEETHIKTLKEFRVELHKEWEDAVIKFAETGEIQNLI